MTEKLDLSNFNVLLGPNNEGKSNILQALVTVLEYLTNPRYNEVIRHSHVIYKNSALSARTKNELRSQTFYSVSFKFDSCFLTVINHNDWLSL